MDAKNMSEITRRSFLRISAGAAALTGVHLPKTARAEAAGSLSTLIDLSLCDGCADRKIPACIQACRSINRNKIPPVVDNIPEPWPRKTIEDWSKKQDVTNRLTPYNYLYVHRAEVTVDGKRQTLFVPRRCMHCDNPACATICPFSANHKNQNGAVVINPNQCFGGAKCRDVCPWEIPQRQSGVGIYLHVLPDFMGNGVMFKCDLCNDRLKEGKKPGCVEACPRKAMLIGPRKDIEAEAEERARRMKGYIYGQKENGGTATLYVSPVSFELLNQTMTRKPGQPDMKPNVERRMVGTDPLGKAVLAAPVLGLAAGLLGWFSRRKTKIKAEEQGHV
ncbi:MAG TPA: 4Fe-4S dicluster domain-containing protein [Smithellaceae bacterium]|jgi:Fe-S-cluster-containing dehydrogenase component|nr:4Fe-4S dicluster domain-containing protein [Smithellaceae bacterium]HOE23049.1 4Fe-4S dicluster domain-containing protein [Smithellaceae bacterium]HPL32074.1 4Fe-4S dicluster domain-containing protein [Smithellaceae bacterium]HPO21276.1 4Fe-4S dicluster domain-containing protein [Smithellaceae bacterium]HQK89716.1 4Fe-4S dicluster domain-containing protein [Smithellaceae bacterium]